MANTTNYNWETPDDTDLVKDGAAAIRTLGSSIDTTTKNLNPQTTTGALAYRSATANVNTALPIGTAGQILAVSGGVPAWINNDQGDITEVQAGTGISVASGTGPIPVVTNTVATAYDAKGDLIVGTGADTFSRLAVGTNTYILTADSAEATGLKWAAPSGITFADYTPSYTNITIGNGTVVARYGQQGKFVFVYWDFVFGSTSSISSASRVSLPKTAKDQSFIGSMYGLDSGTLEVIGQVALASTTLMKVVVPLNGSYGTTGITATFPWTWTTSDRITVSMVYEEA